VVCHEDVALIVVHLVEEVAVLEVAIAVIPLASIQSILVVTAGNRI
jgi:hypothetical protein